MRESVNIEERQHERRRHHRREVMREKDRLINMRSVILALSS